MELTILAQVAQRLCQGQAEYGRFNLATDSRNFRREANEELIDGLIYDCLANLVQRTANVKCGAVGVPRMTEDDRSWYRPVCGLPIGHEGECWKR